MGLRGDCGPGGARRTPWRRARVGKVSAGSGCSRGAWRGVPEERPTRRLRRPCSVPVRGLRVRRARGSAVPRLRVKAAGPALPTGCRCRLCPADPRTDGRTWPGAAPGRTPRRDPAGCGPSTGRRALLGAGKAAVCAELPAEPRAARRVPVPVLPEPSSLLSRPHGRRCPLTPCPVMPNVRGPLVARRGRCELPPAPQLTLIGCSPPRCSSQVRRGGVVASPGRLEAEVLHGSHFHALQRSRCPLQACLEGCRRPKAAPLYLWQTWLCCTACLGCPGLPCALLWVLLPCCCRPQRIRSGLSACPAGTCSAGHIAVSRAAFTARLLGWFVLAERLLSLRCSSTAAPQSLWVQLPVCTLPEHSGCGTGLPPGTRAPPGPIGM